MIRSARFIEVRLKHAHKFIWLHPAEQQQKPLKAGFWHCDRFGLSANGQHSADSITRGFSGLGT
jgi:hypothetical protein